ncbi:hypothetical protein ACQZV8_08755 [Magnetococcales bacterium HHB-1]
MVTSSSFDRREEAPDRRHDERRKAQTKIAFSDRRQDIRRVQIRRDSDIGKKHFLRILKLSGVVLLVILFSLFFLFWPVGVGTISPF